jgi:alpha-beta hydrolase superfamily lysophospholipase
MASEINLTPTASYLDITPATNGAVAGAALPGRSWGTVNDCAAGAVLVHGLGAHSGWFEALGRRLKVRRVYAVAYDQVGFGRRRQEQLTSKQQWFDDLVSAYAYVRKMVKDKPVFVMGNSMGAAVALKVVADGKVKPSGLVMFSPGFDGHPSRFTWSYKIPALLSAFADPEKEVKLPYTPENITPTKSVQTWLYNDPDMRFSPTGKMLLELLKLSMTMPKARSVACPVLMLKGGALDTIVDGKASQRIFERLEAPSKREHVFDEAWHDLMFDPVIDDLVREVCDWMSALGAAEKQKRA